ncbi:MAG: hypothetical protein EZS28_052592 [Streblomastix strix]|uniref:RRM domain-containing protein n=1 Tax=Streblomastix strix TaxID=222440 RepID=A0A5J4S322_9EUKA|nr:MAG: hypothetical protein EZS28_052592 [Streblomastix strix]
MTSQILNDQKEALLSKDDCITTGDIKISQVIQESKIEKSQSVYLIQPEALNSEFQTGIEAFSGISVLINQLNSDKSQVDDPVQLFVYNINQLTTLKDIMFHFSVVGTVLSINIPVTQGKLRGFAFVTMKNSEGAFKAENVLNNSCLKSNLIRIVIIGKCIDLQAIGCLCYISIILIRRKK